MTIPLIYNTFSESYQLESTMLKIEKSIENTYKFSNESIIVNLFILISKVIMIKIYLKYFRNRKFFRNKKKN